MSDVGHMYKYICEIVCFVCVLKRERKRAWRRSTVHAYALEYCRLSSTYTSLFYSECSTLHPVGTVRS